VIGRFSTRELLDFAAAWLALSTAFTFFFLPRPISFEPRAVAFLFGMSLVTAGVGFLLHELAHKVVALRFGQVAAFRADYGMLFIAIVSGMLGFLFAAPGAVHHRGRITARENGLIALAGPVTNLGLAAIFAAPAVVGSGLVAAVGFYGVTINCFLAGFNMLPIGPLDGNTVKDWSLPVYLAVFVPSAALALWALFGFRVPA
jgi:Zn-dependent protease